MKYYINLYAALCLSVIKFTLPFFRNFEKNRAEYVIIKFLRNNIPSTSLRMLTAMMFLFTAVPQLTAQKAVSADSCAGSELSFYQISSQETFAYQKPGAFDFIKYAPKDIADYSRQSFNAGWQKIFSMTALTAFLVIVDQDIIDESQRFGRRIGIPGTARMKTIFKIFDQPIQVPHDLGSALYFIGDGMTQIALTSSFVTYGLIKDDTRALQTASQLAQGLIGVTFTTQLLKHITGRESPLVSTKPGGRWDLFPNQIKYHKKVPKYDAYPSGHLAAAMMAVTVISENYKEYKFIKPLGYTLMTILSYQMLNNGVHWASDYPLALAMGWSFGKLVLKRGRTVIRKDNKGIIESVDFRPAAVKPGGLGIVCSIKLR